MITQAPRRTKIIATLGPSTDDPTVLAKMIEAGVDLVRVNFSHGTATEQAKRIQTTRDAARQQNKEIGVLADLQGPKIRIASFTEGSVVLKENTEFCLDAALDKKSGSIHEVGIDYEDLPNDVRSGDRLLLDDGLIVLQVDKIVGQRIHCKVIVGGKLSNKKGINREGGGLTARSLTQKDLADLDVALESGADYIAVSFPRDAADMEHAKQAILERKGNACVIAKIERTEAVQNIDEIIKASDGVMVARGDLAVEIGDAELIGVQKLIIQRARSLNKPVITATQMMESMSHSPAPTRAEISDVANAVLDGTDAVMLSAESATGKYPVKVVEAMARVCVGAERQRITQISKHRVETKFHRIDEAIAMASMYTANHMAIKAIVALTESGMTPLWMSRIRSGIPIYALSRHIDTQRKVILYRGVYPVQFDVTKYKSSELNRRVSTALQKLKLAQKGDTIILTHGDELGVGGQSNVMTILTID